MANVQKEEGFVKLANEIMDKLCCFRIPGEVRLIVDCVIRKTYGYNKKDDWIANSQMIEMTGLKKGNVSRALSEAITHKIVIKKDNKLCLNNNFDEWLSFQRTVIVSEQKVIESDTKVIRNDNKKLSKARDTIDNKDNIQKTITTNSKEIIFLTELLIGLIKQNYPFLKEKTPSNNDYEEMDRLNRIDGYDYKIIEGVIRWSQQDDFWKQNIRSVPKLRKQFETLLVKAQSKFNERKVVNFD